MNPGGHDAADTADCKQAKLITSSTLNCRKVPLVAPDFARFEANNEVDKHRFAPAAGLLEHSWLSMMKNGVEGFINPTPESERDDVAQWTWLLEYDAKFGVIPPENRPDIKDGWLATLALTGFIMEDVSSRELHLCLGNQKWMIFIVPLRKSVYSGNYLYALPYYCRMYESFVYNLDGWVVHPSKVMSPRMCKEILKYERGGLAWRITGPPVPLLRAALLAKIDLNVDDMLTLLTMLRWKHPQMLRKGDCLHQLLVAVFPEWTQEEVRGLWTEILTGPTMKKKLEGDLDEDVRWCLGFLPAEQQQDYKDYTDALERLDMAQRMKRKRLIINDEDPTTFEWGPHFHFWKRSPSQHRFPLGGWSVRCRLHYRPAKTQCTKEVDCKRECNIRTPDDEDNVIRRLKMWALGHCCCKNKEEHYNYMREYPPDAKDIIFNFLQRQLVPPIFPLPTRIKCKV